MNDQKKLTPLQSVSEMIKMMQIASYTPEGIISELQKHMPTLLAKEEQYTMDAFSAGDEAMQKMKAGEPYTDFINYFKQYKP